MWAFADQGSYKMSLRYLIKNLDKAREQASELKELVNEKFSDEKLFKLFCDSIYCPSEEELEWISTLNEVSLV